MSKHLDRNKFKKSYVVLHPIEVTRIKPKYPDPYKKIPLVIHAPSDRRFKGTSYVLRTVELLKKLGYKFEFLLLERVEHEKAMQLLAEADIVLDKFVLGDYGMLCLEGMSLGKPVITFILEDVFKQYPDSLPIINANVDNLPQKLAMLIKDGNLRYKLGVEGREYVKKYHS